MVFGGKAMIAFPAALSLELQVFRFSGNCLSAEVGRQSA
jgi:hypothetical protein